MSEWIGQALAAVTRGERLAMATVVGAQGSTPREIGARMLVWPDRFTGTIGGGSLERQALDQARKLLAQDQRRHALQDYPLGPLLGQCCGGRVRLLVERLDTASQAWLAEAVARREPFRLQAEFEAGGMTRSVAPATADAPPDGPRTPIPEVRRLSELMQPARPKLVIFGAGHIGQAVARAFAPLPFDLEWLASREDLRPEAGGTHAEILSEDDLEACIEAAPAGTLIAIFTHSHDLDYRLTKAALAKGDFGYLGLIGSRTKRARFESRLKADGVTDADLARLTCPIGIPSLKSKAPAVIAVALAAELLQLTEDFSRVTFEWAAWANLALRWLHLTAGIAWIGSSFYFMWLDSHLKPPANPPKGVAGELWSVHSGGFYHQMKFMVAPEGMPDELHWFKWEAYTTWISGFLLLSLIFYLGADVNLIDASRLAMSRWEAIGAGLGTLVAGWVVYDGLCRSPLGQSLRVFGVVWFLILTAAAWALTRIFSDLGAVMHLGAIIGTVMAANVWLIIIPNQRKVVAQVLAGETPDPSLGKQAKQRSVHNNYMTLPVLFVMISNHYPMIVSAPLNWLWLAGLGLTGWTIRHFFNLRNAGQTRYDVLLLGALAFVTVAVLNETAKPPPPAEVPVPPFTEVRALIDRHCVACHAAQPTHKGVTTPPNGVILATDEGLAKNADKIYARAVASHSMPLNNETHMTDAERASLGAWLKAGAKVAP